MVIRIGRELRLLRILVGHRGNPVRLPRFASIGRKRLFKIARILRDVGPAEPDKDRSSLEELLVVELAHAVLVLANHGILQRRCCGVCPMQAPLMRMRVVEPQRQPFNVPCRTVRLQLVEVGAATPHLSGHVMRFEIHPLVRPRKGVHALMEMHLPSPDQRIPIVLSVPQIATPL